VTAQVNVEGYKTGQARRGAIIYSCVTISGLEKKLISSLSFGQAALARSNFLLILVNDFVRG